MNPQQKVAAAVAAEVKATEKKSEPAKNQTKKEETSAPPAKGKAKPPTLKKENSSLFKSFAKAKGLSKDHSVSDASVAASPTASGPVSPTGDGEGAFISII